MPYRDAHSDESSSRQAICHCIIKEELIGRIDEACYLPTWIHQLTGQKNRIVQARDCALPKEFIGLSNRKIFELLLKSNQLEEEFHPDFEYLPQLSSEWWSRHRFSLDETIDQYLFYFYVNGDNITFLIKDETQKPEKEGRSEEFFSLRPAE